MILLILVTMLVCAGMYYLGYTHGREAEEDDNFWRSRGEPTTRELRKIRS